MNEMPRGILGLNRVMQLGHEAMLQEIQRQLRQYTDNLLKDGLNPNFMGMLHKTLRSIGMDISQLPGMVGNTPGFDPYQVLGLDKTASDAEVKSRFRELTRKLHPDTAGMEGTSFLLQMVLAAYELIKIGRRW
jgi:DnaJ-domain-containing protein 1